ncbi:MAG: HAD family hydrolase [Betaproteobacteria bacterium]|nr:HAD family hydrolase [Betaproteobacteria bacterium]
MRRAVFLDRDGVVNRAIIRAGKPYPPDTLEALEILPGVAQALQKLRAAGYLNVIVTNQPDVGAGSQRREVVEAIHDRLRRDLPLDAVKVCYHVESDHCGCRKPQPGMILEAARELHIDLAESYLVGDRWRDVAAGHAAGCRACFIDMGYAEKRPEKPHVAVKSLPDLADLILAPREHPQVRKQE